MTCKTSAVAVCCSKASRVSVIRRAFSIAMTACAAKFCNSAICLSVKGADLTAIGTDTSEERRILAQRHSYDRTRTGKLHERLPSAVFAGVGHQRRNI